MFSLVKARYDVSGKRILITAEQGFGDLIHFSRYVPLLIKRGATARILEAPKPPITLLETLDPQAIPPTGHAFSEFDIYCPVMSLPYIFSTTIETIPSTHTCFLMEKRFRSGNEN